MMNKTVKELRVIARELGVAKYYSLKKEELINAIDYAQSYKDEYQDMINCEQEEVEYINPSDDYDFSMINYEALEEEVVSNRTVSMFDIERYAKFRPYKTYNNAPISPKQYNLVKSLEINFKVSINTNDCNNFYEMSCKLSKVYQAILDGKVQYRSEQEISERLEGYKPTPKATVKPVQILDEVAVDINNTIENKLQNKTFRTKFVSMMKRLLG